MTTPALRSGSSGGPAVSGPLLRGPVPAWAALYFNVLAFSSLPTVVPLPQPVGQLIAQAMLPLAILLALMANPGAAFRLNPFLVVLTTMVIVALIVSLHNQFFVGSTYRAIRLFGFILVLWLLTPWWGKPELPLLRAHMSCLRVVLGSVVLGALLAPGAAFSYEGRLSGAVWPVPPTQVAHYSAVFIGCTVVLWFCGVMRGRPTLLTVVGAGMLLLLTHTRTALGALVLGLVVAGASLFVDNARVRRTSIAVGVIAATSWAVFAPFLIAWAGRGQSAQEATQLTGRTKVWSAIFALRRPWTETIFGSGLSNKSFNGLPIDSNWVATYLDQGWFGVGIQALFLIVLAVTAFFRPRGPRRALAFFLVAYCVMASFTETGLGDASPYLLELAVAASLLVVPSRTAGA